MELAREYGWDLLDIVKKYGNSNIKVFGDFTS
jgi:hypothetical protein